MSVGIQLRVSQSISLTLGSRRSFFPGCLCLSAFLCFCIAFGVILSFSRIAARRIDKETREAQPLMDSREEISASLDDLDAFESGKLDNYDEI